jgi:hypothetical protein
MDACCTDGADKSYMAGQTMLLVINGCKIMQYRSNNEFLEIDEFYANIV